MPSTILWGPRPSASDLWSIGLLFVAVATTLWLGVHRFRPDLLFSFVHSQRAVWALLMFVYPLLSVYPQGMIYRAFLMRRYAGLIPNRSALIFTSALAFAFMHLIFRNWLAVVLTFGGGILFAWRYASTGSLRTSSLEHALHGCWLFTVGLGQYFTPWKIPEDAGIRLLAHLR